MRLRANYSSERMLIPVNSVSDKKVSDNVSDVFFYSSLHDLKSPVNNIEALTHILKNELSLNQSEEIKSIIDKIEQCINITQTKIKELTVATKMHADPYNRIDKIEFEDLLEEVIAENEMAIQSSNIIIEHSFEVSQIEYSRPALKSILLNLITNAIKYRSPERDLVIEVITKAKNGRILLKVTDNGLGMDLTKKENKLFKLFKRLHHHVEGTGLGLYLVKKIVEREGGKINVKSKLNLGTSFEVIF